MTQLKIPNDIFEQIVAQARDAAPIEACGILAGKNGAAEKLYKMTNADRSSEHFTMEPQEQFAVVKDIRADGLRMLAIYHSHPASPARPSAEDIRMALTPDVTYVIVSLQNPRMPVIKGFDIEDGIVNEVAVEIFERKKMSSQKEPILRLPQSVREDVLGYRKRVDELLHGQTTKIAFKGYRVPMGIYEQRTEDKYMVRVRIGAGLVLPYQLEKIAQLSTTYGDGVVHVTTRQDIQIHRVNIENTPDVFEGLLEVGLSSRGGGGNTVRNITACPLAGICPKEQFDVAPYSIALAEYLLQDKSSFNLPRKFKAVFSGCPEDCAIASTADIAFFAHTKNSTGGFAVYAGGGLGPNPSIAAKIEDFIAADEIFEVTEAVKRLFDRYGDRANKHKARLRYVLQRFGAEEFGRLYKIERNTLKANGLPVPIPEIRDLSALYAAPAAEQISGSKANLIPERTTGRYSVRLRLKNGDIPADDLVEVGRIAQKFGHGVVRTTQLQDIHISGVAGENTGEVKNALGKLSIDVAGEKGPKVVACAGASTCKLGLCLSKGLADALTEKLTYSDFSQPEIKTVIRINGCPNACGNHYLGRIGFQGVAKRINGKLMPFYDVFAGAVIGEGRTKFAEKTGTVPAKAIPQLLAEASNGSVDITKIRKLVSEYEDVSSKQIPEDYYYDFGASEVFSLAGRGPGECGAGVMDVIKLDIDEAKDAVKAAHQATMPKVKSQNVYNAIVASARALLVAFGLEPKKDREIFSAFSTHIVKPRWVRPQTQQILDDAIDWRMGDKESIENLTGQVEELVHRIEELFLSLDANLKFRVEPVKEEELVANQQVKTHKIDLCGVPCPMNFVKAKLEIEKIKIGEVLEVILDDGEPLRNVPASFAEQGQEVLDVSKIGGQFCVKILRKK